MVLNNEHSNIMFSGMLAMNPNTRRALENHHCGFMSPQLLSTVGRVLRGEPVGLLCIGLNDFYTIVATGGEELGMTVLEILQDEARKVFAERFPSGRIVATEGLGMDIFCLFFSLPEQDQANFYNAYANYRFRLQETLARRFASMFSQEPELRVGSAYLKPSPAEETDRQLFKALCQAQRASLIRPDSERFTLYRDFLNILDKGLVTSVFQPIIDFATGQTMGWEAFSRGPEGSPFHSPSPLFGFAADFGELYRLERICRRKALASLGELHNGRKLFLNIHPQTLNDPQCIFEDTFKLIKDRGIEPQRVVFEFTERQNQKDPDLLIRKLEICRQKGFLVAVDDVGAGNSSLQLLSQIRPDFIKADVSLTSGIHANPIKRTMVETLVLLADKFGGKVIAEGIESDIEFSSLVSMGVQAGQGYLFSYPLPDKPDIGIRIPAKTSIHDVDCHDLKCSTPVGNITQEATVIPSGSPIRGIKDGLEDKPPMGCYVITDKEDRPLGLLMNYNLDRRLGTRYGISLYYNRQVDRIMDASPLIVDHRAPIEEVAREAMNRHNQKIYDDIIVAREGKLLGTVSVQKMLDTLTQVQVELAKGSNPLTGLPGNVAIEQEIERRTRQKIASSLIYIDLDNFKIYNDVYGFKSGDMIIKLTAALLKEAIHGAGNPDDFVGHIGGDDFLIISGQPQAEPIGRRIAELFSTRVPEFYHEEDRERGFIVATGRDGQQGRFPLVSASIGILDVEFEKPFSLEELSHRAAEVKKFAKSRPGNSVVRDRRAPLGA